MSQPTASGSRPRAPNFSKEEQLLLCRVLEQYSHIIESKKTDNIKQAQKQEAWNKVTDIYNANTKQLPRTVDNLISCYRNMKSKIKKQHSESKMVLKDHKESLLSALEENGTDWEAVSETMQQPIQLCKNTFEEIQKDLKKKENQYKKVIMGTGGGPPPSEDDDDALNRFKKLIEPQIDGLYTIYDGDAILMGQYQESLPETERILPIEHNYYKSNGIAVDIIVPEEEIEEKVQETNCEVDIYGTPKLQNSTRPFINRKEILTKKKDSALVCNDKAERPTSSSSNKKTTDTFISLSIAKLELVRLQKMALEQDMKHKEKIFELELENLIKENKHKEIL